MHIFPLPHRTLRARVRACAYAHMRACVCIRARMRACVRVRACARARDTLSYQCYQTAAASSHPCSGDSTNNHKKNKWRVGHSLPRLHTDAEVRVPRSDNDNERRLPHHTTLLPRASLLVHLPPPACKTHYRLDSLWVILRSSTASS